MLGYVAAFACAIGIGALFFCGGWAVILTWGGFISLAPWVSVGVTAFYKSYKIRVKVNKLKEQIEEMKIYLKNVKASKEEFEKLVS